jgi:hypothetical protein
MVAHLIRPYHLALALFACAPFVLCSGAVGWWLGDRYDVPGVRVEVGP